MRNHLKLSVLLAAVFILSFSVSVKAVSLDYYDYDLAEVASVGLENNTPLINTMQHKHDLSLIPIPLDPKNKNTIPIPTTWEAITMPIPTQWDARIVYISSKEIVQESHQTGKLFVGNADILEFYDRLGQTKE
jgi:hypothetical protein